MSNISINYGRVTIDNPFIIIEQDSESWSNYGEETYYNKTSVFHINKLVGYAIKTYKNFDNLLLYTEINDCHEFLVRKNESKEIEHLLRKYMRGSIENY